MKKRVILKSYRDTGDSKVLFAYADDLKKKGWELIPIEGGHLSPDGSTLFISFRSGHYGELLQVFAHKEAEYLAIVKQLLASGDFVEW